MAARYMLYALTGLDGTTIGNEDNEVIVMLSGDSLSTFEFSLAAGCPPDRVPAHELRLCHLIGFSVGYSSTRIEV